MIKYFLFFSLLGFAQAKSIAILSKSQCRAIVIHHKAGADVEYKAGIDTKGKPVTPADLPTNNNFNLGKDVTIDLQIPIETYAPFFPPAPPPLPGSGNSPTRDYINDTFVCEKTGKYGLMASLSMVNFKSSLQALVVNSTAIWIKSILRDVKLT